MTGTTFSSEFKDQWDILEKYATFGTDSMSSISRFFKEQARIEATYAEATSKLVKTYRDELKKVHAPNTNFQKGVQSSTTHAGWNQLLNEVESTAASHASFSTNLIEKVRVPLKEQIKENEKQIKVLFDEIRRLAADLKKQVDVMEKSREMHEKSNRDMNTAYVSFEKVNKDPKARKDQVEKSKAEAEKRASVALGSVDSYNRIIVETNQQKAKFYSELLPKVLDDFQAFDEKSRIEFSKTSLTTYSDLFHAREEPLAKSSESLAKIFGLISAQFDTECFIKLARTGDPGTPPDFKFGETASIFSKRKVGQTHSNTSLEKLCSPLTSKEDDEVVAMPLKQGKRKATDRIKLINKELPRIALSVSQLDRLLEAQARDQNKESQNILQEQRASAVASLNHLIERKTRLETYLGIPASTRASVSSSSSPVSGLPSPTESISFKQYATASPARDEPPLRKSTTSSSSAARASNGSLEVVSKARAVFDFVAGGDNGEISMETDEMFDVHQKLEDGWWQVTSTKTKEMGLVPGNYMEEI